MVKCAACSALNPDGRTECGSCGKALGAPTLPLGSRLMQGRYELTRLLQGRSNGADYAAVHALTKRKVVIKQYLGLSHSDQAVGNWLGEVRRWAKLNHPNLVRVLDVFSEEQSLFLVSEFIEGLNLQLVVQEEGALGDAEAVRTVGMVAAAVEVLHQSEVVHSQISLHSIVLTPHGQALLLGGAGQEMDPPHSLGFAPPEATSSIEVGPAGDVYSLGAVLYALLYGVAPPAAQLRLAGQGLPHHTPGELGDLLHRCLALEPELRPSARELNQSLAALASPLAIGSVPSPSATVYPSTAPELPPKEPRPQASPTHPSDVAAPGAAQPSRAGGRWWGWVGSVAVTGVLGWVWLAQSRPPTLGATGLEPLQIQAVEFAGCTSQQGDSDSLLAGVASRCTLRVSYTGRAGQLNSARFTYGLEFNQGQEVLSIDVPGEDQWSNSGGNTTLSQDVGRWTFTLPLNVRKREDRAYHTLVVRAELSGINRQNLRFVAKIPVTQPKSAAAQSTAPQVPSTPQAPTFTAWALQDCRNATGAYSTAVAGQALTCYVAVEYDNPSNTALSRADFTFSFEYLDDYGQLAELKLSGTDTWTPSGGSASLEDQGSRYVFGIPVSIKNRPNAPYQTLVVVGTLKFANGSSKRILEKIPIYYPVE